MCMYLFLLCIVFACEVCTVMVNNNNNKGQWVDMAYKLCM